MGFSCGIIGLPNVGKSTIFNALTSAKAAAANFPFCTIEPNTGAVPVPDARLKILSNLAKSEKIVPTQITFVDIAGLIRGASKGEGLGNQFLGHIRTVDAVAHVVRCFADENVVHVDGAIDPIRDLETIETELILSDLDSIQRQVKKIQNLAKSGERDAKRRAEVCAELEEHLSQGSPARTFQYQGIEDSELHDLINRLLTSKPMLCVANVDEAEIGTTPSPTGARPIDRLSKWCDERKVPLVIISGKVEAEISELGPEDRAEYLNELGAKESGLDRLTSAGYRLLNLITFFTVGPKETHAWTAASGSKGPVCAGKIHTDFERGYIRAEVIGYNDFVTCGGELKAREAGKQRTEGKEYVMQDGDIVHFRFNV